MKDSKHRKNVRMGVSKDTELAALEHKQRQQAVAKDGKRRKSLSPEQRREILNQLFFEGEARTPYVKQFYLLLRALCFNRFLRPGEEFLCGGDRRHVAFAFDDTHPCIRCRVSSWDGPSEPVVLQYVCFSLHFLFFGLAYFLLFVYRVPTNVVIPPEILARTNPKMAELLIGLCAGIAAAYMLIHRETVSCIAGGRDFCRFSSAALRCGAFNLCPRICAGLASIRSLCYELGGNHPYSRRCASVQQALSRTSKI